MSSTPRTASPPTSLLPTLTHLLSLLSTTTSASSPSSADSHTRSLEIAAATATLRTHLSEAERWAKELPGGEVGEEGVEEVIRALEGRVGEGRRTLEMVAKLATAGGQAPAKDEATTDGDVAMA